MKTLWMRRAAVVPRSSVFSHTIYDGACFVHAGESVEKRPSRRRYAAFNTRGRASQAKELVDMMKKKSAQDAKAFYEALQPRDRLDILRLLYERRKKRQSDQASSKLTKYYSVPFEKKYFFREEDVEEKSTLGRGPGGQATNRRMQTAIVKHVPSGLIVKFSRFPSLWLNRRAARELLNLRLEEHLLGPASRIKGARLQARDSRRCHWLAFLTGESPLPSAAVSQMALKEDAAAVPVTTAVLFGSECHTWWPKLRAATESAAAAAHDSTGDDCVPLLLQYLFPVVYADSGRAEREEMEACKSNKAVHTNVRRALTCFCELFGLRLRHIPASVPPEASRVVLEKDGLNWVDVRELGMTPEARAIIVFFKKEASTAEGSAGGAWAAEALQCFSEAIPRRKPSETVQLSSAPSSPGT
ncbi:RF-1 domain family protein [Leishmania donovani]|uniref:RF-1 domain family protein n=1 Tax=Leishmania donovani TaxID=5661 RepID=A0A504XEA9_LEIDO|nr:RF-1 domain family protein [Leishmania donovani]